MLAVLGYGLLLIGVLALEGIARTRARGTTAGDALTAAMRTTPGRAVVLLGWLWVGVHFLAR